MTIKYILTIIILSLFISACAPKNLSQDSMKNSKKKELLVKNEIKREDISAELLSDINYILFLLKQNDLDGLNNRFINKQYGIHEILKDSEKNILYFEKKLQIDEISNEVDSFDIKQEEVTFDCSPNDDANYGWNKEGVFISANTKPYLSDLMKKSNLHNVNIYNQEDIKIANIIEKTSYEVIVPYNMIFYITKLENLWYITLIDKVKTECS
jgi:polyhydroxyalkanoate synthesis regulator phasin